MRQILVSGGTGYIGSHTVVELQAKNYEVIIADNLSNSHIDVLDGIEKISGKRPQFEKIDFAHREETEDFFRRNKDIVAIIHFAAYKAVGESMENPLKYYRNNLVGLINILDCMNTEGIQHLVFSSSATVYGQPDILPASEQSPFKPATSPYGNTKQISEEMIRDTVLSAANLSAIALRYFNPIGAHPSALIGELPIGVPNNLVPFITQTAIGIRDILRVFGNDYNTPDGTAVRDYIHVVDLAKAHVFAIERLLNKEFAQAYEYFNLGTGTGLSVMEIIKSFEKVSGCKLNYEVTSRRPGDVEQVWADTQHANEVLGWKAESSLDETLLSAWNWEKYFRSIDKKNQKI